MSLINKVSLISTVLLLFVSSCNNNSTQSKQEKSPSQKQTIEKDTTTAEPGSISFEDIIKELTGIEKFYVQDDLYRLLSLLKFKNDERYQDVEDYLYSVEDHPEILIVEVLDEQNGYMEFTLHETSCNYQIVYWNKNNGDKLIAESQTCCTMFCEGEISFQLYSPEADEYTDLKTEQVIKGYDVLVNQLANKQEQGGLDYEFELPQNGKNIRYCEEEDCRELVWDDGMFRY